MKSRSYRILNDLINNKKLNIDDLAYKYEVSKRTIRYDINNLNKYLSKFNLSIVNDSEKGVKIEGLETGVFAKKILDLGKEDVFFTPNERKYFILFKLFISYEPIIIDYLSNSLNVSRNTILKNLNNAEDWLNRNGIKLIRKTNYGVKIDGKEEKIREGFLRLLYGNFKIGELIDYLKNSDNDVSLKKIEIVNLNEVFEDINFNKIEEVVNFIQDEVGYKFTEKSYLDLNFYLAITIIRLKNGKNVIVDNNLLDKLKKTSEFIVSTKIFEILNQLFDIPVTKSEIAYFTLKLLSAGVSSDVTPENKFKNDLKYIVNEMINIVEKDLDIKLKDEELYKGLLLHLKPLLNRISYDNEVRNPLLDEIKTKYQKIYVATKRAAKIIEANYNKYISEDEIAYIAMHFGAAYERRRRLFNRNKLKTVIVCPSGIGTSKLITSKLQHEFQELNIIDTLTIKKLKNNFDQYKDADLIISTVDLSFVKNNLVVINPIFTDFERKKISEYIENHQDNMKMNEDLHFYDYKFSIDEFFDEIKGGFILKKDEREFKEKLIDFFEKKNVPVKYDLNEYKSQETFGLLDLLNRDRIMKKERVQTWEESIELIGNVLVEQNAIEKRYINSIIDIINDKGPYVVFAPGVALVHAKPEDGVNMPSAGILVLDEAVNYSENKEVNIVIILAPIDRSSHIPAISDLIEIFNDENSIKQFSKIKDEDEIYKHIQMIL